jgi:hypothetical protein
MRSRHVALVALVAAACSRFGPVYPPRPNPTGGPPLADPEPARLAVHVSMTRAALEAALNDAAPQSGDGTFPLLGSDRKYTWERGPLAVAFSQERIVLTTTVNAVASLPLKELPLSLDLHVEAEPIVSSEYAVKLQSVRVKVTSDETKLAIAERLAGIYEKIEAPIQQKLEAFAYDLSPMLTEAYARVSRPIDLPLGDAVHGCATLRVLDVEAGPTILADGIEKDIALVVAPGITLPCAEAAPDAGAEDDGGAPPPPPSLPPLSNVAAVTPGPFTVVVPIAARYEELTRAMSLAFTDGKLFFSTEYPKLYLERPQIYESEGSLVLQLHIAGPVHKFGIDTDLDGNLFLTGRPQVADNELSLPDLEPTIETKNFLLSLKAMTDGDAIRDQARQSLRLDLGQRLRDAREKLGQDLTFSAGGGCFKAEVDHFEVTGVYPHASYLRVYVSVTAQARAMLPCPADAAAPAARL